MSRAAVLRATPFRIKVVGGPWPERIGCEGVTVPAPADLPFRYPQHGLGSKEVVILLDDDPCVPAVLPPDAPPFAATRSKGWTCVINADAVEVVA